MLVGEYIVVLSPHCPEPTEVVQTSAKCQMLLILIWQRLHLPHTRVNDDPRCGEWRIKPCSFLLFCVLILSRSKAQWTQWGSSMWFGSGINTLLKKNSAPILIRSEVGQEFVNGVGGMWGSLYGTKG